jgi:hypothetical protein
MLLDGKGPGMKCPCCWTEKAYVRPVSPLKQLLLTCTLLVPMKCQHCYHKFTVSWFSTIGKQTRPPVLRIAPATRGARPSYAARHYAATRNGRPAELDADEQRPPRADAA